jgi:hypothetical protein
MTTEDSMSRTLQMLTRAQTAIPTVGGEPLEPTIQARMERSFRHDFSTVRVHQGRAAADLGALAFTSGKDIHFAPGQYDPHGSRGQELLGHELAHVVQQSSGRVQPTVQGKGMSINDDERLEREADEAGARAARGEPAGIPGGGTARSTVVQGVFTNNRVRIDDEGLLDYLVRALSELAAFQDAALRFTAAREDGEDHDLLDWVEVNLGSVVRGSVDARLRAWAGTAGARSTARDEGNDHVPSRPLDAGSLPADPADTDPRDKGKDKTPYAIHSDDAGPSGSGHPHHPRWRTVAAHACKKPGHGTTATELCNLMSGLSGAVIYPGGDAHQYGFLGTGVFGGIVLTCGSVVRIVRAIWTLYERRTEDRTDAELELVLGVLGLISGLTSVAAGSAGMYAVDHDSDELATSVAGVMGYLSLIVWAISEALGAAPMLAGLATASGGSWRTAGPIASMVARLLGSAAKFIGIVLMILAAVDGSVAVFSVGFGFTLLGSLLTMVVGAGHALRTYLCGHAPAERDDASSSSGEDIEAGPPPSTEPEVSDAERTRSERGRDSGTESPRRSVDHRVDQVEVEGEVDLEAEAPTEHAASDAARSDGDGEKVEAEVHVPLPTVHDDGDGEKVEPEVHVPLPTEPAAEHAVGGSEKVEPEVHVPLYPEHANGGGEKVEPEVNAPLSAEHANGGGEKVEPEVNAPLYPEHADGGGEKVEPEVNAPLYPEHADGGGEKVETKAPLSTGHAESAAARASSVAKTAFVVAAELACAAQPVAPLPDDTATAVLPPGAGDLARLAHT